MDKLTIAFEQYQKGVEYLTMQNLFVQTDENYRMFEGDQWRYAQSGGEVLPSYNIIAPIVKYKVAMVAQNLMSINYSSVKELAAVSEHLNFFAAKTWERLKLDRVCWDVVTDSCIAGNSYLYFYQNGSEVAADVIDNTSIFFADEQEKDVQAQKYILIAQRRFVADVKAEAAACGVSGNLILPEDDGKCLSILKLWKQDGCVHISRSTKFVEYQRDTAITGLKLYPIACMSWEQKKGSARSEGAVKHLIPNQIEINKGLARLSLAVKKFAYPMLAYNSDAVENPDCVDKIGAAIAVSGPSVQNIENVIKYVQPAQISPLASSIIENLESKTRELSGVSDAVMGQIDPEKASGAAIIAVRDAAAVPLNSTIANFKQFVEDIALVWYDMWACYNPNGFSFESDGGKIAVSGEVLQGLAPDVRIDVSPANPYSKYAKEQTLENLLNNQYISFEEYVAALDDDSAAPKGKLVEILEKRQR